MKKLLILVTLAFAMSYCSEEEVDPDTEIVENFVPEPAVPGTWRKVVYRPRYSHFIHDAFPSIVNDEVYLNYHGGIFKFNPITFKIDSITRFEVTHFAGYSVYLNGTGFSINNKFYFGLGYIQHSTNGGPMLFDFVKSFREYDPATNKWTEKAPYPINEVAGAYAFSINGKGYVGSGSGSSGFNHPGNLYEYDPEKDTWTQKEICPCWRDDIYAAFVIGSKAYVGSNVGFWEYNPAMNKWTKKSPLPTDSPGVSFSSNEKGIISANDFGGEWGQVFEYDPVKDQWKRIPDFKGPFAQVGFAINEKYYLGLGYYFGNSAFYRELWEYTP
jgi:hypothetical protein